MTVKLTSNFLSNARGFTFLDSAGVTWSFNQTTNELTATAGGGGAGTVTSVGYSVNATYLALGGTASPITTSGAFTLDLSTTAKANLALAATALQSVSIATGTGLAGGPLGASGSTVSLANTAVTPGSYTSANITVDAQGRLTAASSGVPGGVPSTIPDLEIWLETDNINASGSAWLQRIQDRTPWTAAILAANKVGQIAVSTTQLNGLNTITYPGNTASIYPLITPLLFKQGFTAFYVLKGASSATGQALLGSLSSGGLALYLGTAGTPKVNLTESLLAVACTCSVAWTAGTWFQGNLTYNLTNGAFAFRQARAAANSGTSAVIGLGGGGLGGGNVTTDELGGDGSPPGTFLNAGTGQAALIIYNRVLTGAEISTMETYLLNKWGV